MQKQNLGPEPISLSPSSRSTLCLTSPLSLSSQAFEFLNYEKCFRKMIGTFSHLNPVVMLIPK